MAADAGPAAPAAATVGIPPGGRPQQYRVEDIADQLGARATFSPADVQRVLRCSESSARRLLAEGQERGTIVRRDVGVYAVVAPGGGD